MVIFPRFEYVGFAGPPCGGGGGETSPWSLAGGGCWSSMAGMGALIETSNRDAR